MMNFRHTIPLVIVASMLTSCYTTLRVRVDTFDRKALLESEEYRRNSIDENYKKVAVLLNGEFQQKQRDAYVQIVTSELRKLENIDADKATIRIAISNVKESIVATFKAADVEYLKAFEEYAKFFQSDASFSHHQAWLFMIEGDKIKQKYFDELASNLRMISKSGDSELRKQVEKSLKNISNNVSEQTEQIMGTYGISIGNDSYASLITKAPGKYWRKYKSKVSLDEVGGSPKRSGRKARYNKTVARTFFGNADIAVKMENPGNFVIKGVRLDANESIKASFKVLNQGIKYFALSGGIPVPSKDSDGDKPGSVQIPELAENEKLKQEMSHYKSSTVQATKSFLNQVFAYADRLDSGSVSDKKEALFVISQAYEVYKAQLNQLNQEK